MYLWCQDTVRTKRNRILNLWPTVKTKMVQKVSTPNPNYVLSNVQLFVTPWTVAHQAPLSMGLYRQESWAITLQTHPLTTTTNFFVSQMSSREKRNCNFQKKKKKAATVKKERC